jgi:polyhydroxyalkanoate synthase
MGPGGGLDALGREVGRTVGRVRNGIRFVAGTQWAPIGPTPSRVVWQEGKAELRHYSGQASPRHKTDTARPLSAQHKADTARPLFPQHKADTARPLSPQHGPDTARPLSPQHKADTARPLGPEPGLAPPVLVLGGLVGRSYIFDLHDGNSFVARMLDAGFDTYVLDWGAPDADDSANTLETYLARYFPRALRAALAESGASEISVIGYCMGGAMALHALAAQPDLPVRNLVLIATPVDFRHLGSMVDAVCEGRLDPATVLDESGNVPASLISAFFAVMKPTAPVLKYGNLLQNLWNDEYLKGYQALSRCFEDHVPLPGAAFLQIAQQWMRDNAFVTGNLRLDGRAVHLADLTMPVLVVTGVRDELVPAASTGPTAGLLTGTKPETLDLDAGHASLTTGRTAAKHTVPQILDWLAAHSDPCG